MSSKFHCYCFHVIVICTLTFSRSDEDASVKAGLFSIFLDFGAFRQPMRFSFKKCVNQVRVTSKWLPDIVSMFFNNQDTIEVA